MAASLTRTSTSNRHKSLERKLASYAIASGAFLAFSPNPAPADIVYSGPQDITIVPFDFPSSNNYTLNLTGTGPLSGTATNYVFGNSTFEGTELYLTDPTNGQAVYDSSTPSEAALAAGTLISSSSTFDGGSNGIMGKVGKISKGDWAYVQNKYLGLSFVVGGQTYYGWAELTFPDNSGTAATLLGWAYDDTPNEAIAAGAGASVPEPSTVALTLLAMGAVGIAAMRRSRKQARDLAAC